MKKVSVVTEINFQKRINWLKISQSINKKKSGNSFTDLEIIYISIYSKKILWKK